MAGTHNERGQFIPDRTGREIKREKGKKKSNRFYIYWAIWGGRGGMGQSGGVRPYGELKRMAEDRAREGWRLSLHTGAAPGCLLREGKMPHYCFRPACKAGGGGGGGGSDIFSPLNFFPEIIIMA